MTELNQIALKILSDGKGILAADEFTLTLSNLFDIVPVLSSAASIPLPDETIFSAMEFNSDI